jgi:hypothetical protein
MDGSPARRSAAGVRIGRAAVLRKRAHAHPQRRHPALRSSATGGEAGGVTPSDGQKTGPSSAAGVRVGRPAVPRKRPMLTRNGGILHYVLRQLAAKKAA